MLIAKFLNYFDKTEDQIQDNNKVNVITVLIFMLLDLLVQPIFFSFGRIIFRHTFVYQV